MLLDKVYKIISDKCLINKGETVVAAISGGPDSVCLLHVLHVLSPKLGISLHAVHINHMLRGCESDKDEAFVRELCGTLGIPLMVKAVDIAGYARQNGMSVEEAGRDVRYRELEEYAESVGAAKIAVAHNRNDQAETVMMHIVRGTGLAGLAGMEYLRGKIIRPLLDISRAEIEDYCRVNNLKPRTDSSNLKCDYARNRIRLEILPLINSGFGGDITSSLCRLSALASRDNNFLEECAQKVYKECMQEQGESYILFDAVKLSALHPSIGSRVVRRAIEYVRGSLKGIESLHTDMVLEFSLTGRTGAVLQLPGRVRAGMSYGRLKIYMEKEKEAEDGLGNSRDNAFCVRINIPGTTVIEGMGLLEAEVLDKQAYLEKRDSLEKQSNLEKQDDLEKRAGLEKRDSFGMRADVRMKAADVYPQVQYFDYDLVNKGIYLRNRVEGDIFTPAGSRFSKKLKKYFIDNKIPRDLRDKIPLAAIDNEIVWIIGYKTSDKFKVTENTKRVLKLKYYIK